jgi:apolipoprotein N-acyltransferase
LFGAVTRREDTYYNSAILLSAQGKHLCRYDKIHLVPFGEYIPFNKLLSFLETIVPIGEFSRGKIFTVFPFPDKFSVLICFEDLFPEISRQFVKRGAGLLVNITNDAWFGKTSAPYQHLQASVLRAVENRRFLVRAANTGISGFIDPGGKIISLLADPQGEERFISAYATQTIYSQEKLTFYTRFGDLFLFSLFLPVAYGIINKLNLK